MGGARIRRKESAIRGRKTSVWSFALSDPPVGVDRCLGSKVSGQEIQGVVEECHPFVGDFVGRPCGPRKSALSHNLSGAQLDDLHQSSRTAGIEGSVFVESAGEQFSRADMFPILNSELRFGVAAAQTSKRDCGYEFAAGAPGIDRFGVPVHTH